MDAVLSDSFGSSMFTRQLVQLRDHACTGKQRVATATAAKAEAAVVMVAAADETVSSWS